MAKLHADYSRLPVLKGCFMAGLLPAVLTPPLFYLLVWHIWPDLIGYIYITMGALIIGLAFNLTVGLFFLALMDPTRITTMFYAIILGMLIPLLWLTAYGIVFTEPSMWGLMILFSLLGGICGAVASYLSRRYIRRNKELKEKGIYEVS